MTYYKIIQNGQVIDAGYVFLKWNTKKNRLYICDVNEAQFVQSFDQSKIYKAYWLKPSDIQAEEAEVIIIQKNEFDEIRALLDDNEEIIIPPEPQAEPVETPAPEVPEEHPLTISEMREIIREQQEQIAILSERIQEIMNH